MKIKLLDDYKSLRTGFEWTVPNFSVLTGVNGSGKTHLLEVLFRELQSWPTNGGKPGPTSSAEVEPDRLPCGGVIFADGDWRLQNSSSDLNKLHNLSVQAIGHCNRNRAKKESVNNANELYGSRLAETLRRNWDDRQRGMPLNQTHVDLLPPSYAFSTKLGLHELSQEIASVIIAHDWKVNQRCLNLVKAGKPADFAEVSEELGPAPWQVIDDFLTEAQLPLRVTKPTGQHLHQYHFTLQNTISGVEVPPGQLSSGERVILAVAMWILATARYGVPARVALLDEPDAHLHPALIPGFIRAIRKIFVAQCGMKVVIATHRPETMFQAPIGTVFLLEQGKQSPQSIDDYSRAAYALTSSYFTALPPLKWIFCEADDDVDFYEAIQATSVKIGRSDPLLPLLSFKSIATPNREHGNSGGRTKVENLAKLVKRTGMANLVAGLVDRDRSETEVSGVYQIQRYSIENYLIDPVYFYLSLLEAGFPPTVPKELALDIDDVAAIRSFNRHQMQQFTDAIIVEMETVLQPPTASTGVASVEYTNGVQITHPSWLHEEPGKDLLKGLKANYKVEVSRKKIAPALSMYSLTKALQRSRLMPIDLDDLIMRMRGSTTVAAPVKESAN